MAAVTLITPAVFTTTAGDKVTAAFTPAVGDLLVVVSIATGVQPGAITDTLPGGTYTLAHTSVTRVRIDVRDNLIPSATSMTVTASQAGSSGGGLFVFKVTGMTRTGLGAVWARGDQAFIAAATPAVTCNQAFDTNFPSIVGLFNSDNPAAVTPPASWTEDPTPDLGYATPATGGETARRDSGETGTTITWGSTSVSAGNVAAVNLDTRPWPKVMKPPAGVDELEASTPMILGA